MTQLTPPQDPNNATVMNNYKSNHKEDSHHRKIRNCQDWGTIIVFQ